MSECCNYVKLLLQGGDEHYEIKSAASENGKIFRLNIANNEHYCRIKLDKGCVPIRHGFKQCDYLFIKCDKDTVDKYIFVELKGSSENASDGFRQILGAISFLKEKGINLSKNKIHAIIVGGSDAPGMNKIKEDFKRMYGFKLIHKTGKILEYD